MMNTILCIISLHRPRTIFIHIDFGSQMEWNVIISHCLRTMKMRAEFKKGNKRKRVDLGNQNEVITTTITTEYKNSHAIMISCVIFRDVSPLLPVVVY